MVIRKMAAVLLLVAGCAPAAVVDVRDVPEPVRPIVKQALQQREAGEVDAAIQTLEQGLQAHPEEPFLHHHLARCAIIKSGQPELEPEKRQQWFDRGIEHWRTATELDPDFYRANYNLGVISYRQADRVDDPEERARLRAQAKAYWEQAVQANPKLASGHYNLGTLAHEEEKYEAAKAHYQDTLEADPTHLNAMANLALCEFHLAETRKEGVRRAADRWRDILKLDPNHLYARFNLGRVAVETEDWDTALAHWQAATQAEPTDRSAWFLQSRAWYYQALVYEKHQPDPEKALEAIRKAYQMDRDNIEYRQTLRRIERQQMQR